MYGPRRRRDRLHSLVACSRVDWAPYVYQGPNWCSGDACDPHANGGVASYWFYLLSRGGSTGGQGCGGDISPLDPDPIKAVDLATEILFVALRDHFYIADGGFHDMANATISASLKLHGDSVITDTVRDAWHAVNVWENYKDGDPLLRPVRGESAFDPWQGLTWHLEDDALESDIQIDFSASFNSDIDTNGPLVSRTVPTEEIDGETVGKLSIALQPNQVYFWRVRPHSSEPWGNCEPIHWFTTGDLPAIGSINGGVHEDIPPGTFIVKPEQITGRDSSRSSSAITTPVASPIPRRKNRPSTPTTRTIRRRRRKRCSAISSRITSTTSTYSPSARRTPRVPPQ